MEAKMNGLFGDFLSGILWAKIAPIVGVICIVLILVCGFQYWMIRSYKAEVKVLQNEIESCRSALKGAEDAAFMTDNQNQVLRNYMEKLGKNVINPNGDINEEEFKTLLNEIRGGGKKK